MIVMQLRQDARWDLVIPTSMGVRLTPDSGQPFHASSQFAMTVTSAESNVGSVASYLGRPVKVLTNFVEGSPVSTIIKANLRARGMAYEGPDLPQGGAWGYRHQFNLADSGFGPRGPRVWNDRAGEVGRVLNVKDFDLDRLFDEEGVKIVHLSGLVAALSPQTSTFCLEVASAARKHGTKVAFDLNYRASFWEGRENELRAAFSEIASEASILIGNEEDFQLSLGVKGPEAGGLGLEAKLDGFKEMMSMVAKDYQKAEFLGTTLREVVSANTHRWGAVVYSQGRFAVAEPREIGVVDRIGGGDGFVGGLLYGILSGWDAEKSAQFGWASGAMAATMLTDYGQPADEDQVWSVWKGNARVKR